MRRVVKRVIAALLAAIIAISAGIIGFAENNEEIEVRYKDSDFGEYLCIYCEKKADSFETVNIYQRNENNEKTLLESLGDTHRFYSVNDGKRTYLVIEIDGDILFADKGSYTVEFIAKETPSENCPKEADFSVDFDFSETSEPETEYIDIDITVEVGEEIDLIDYYTLPEDYLGSVYHQYRYNYIDDKYPDKIVSITDKTKLKAIREGSDYIYIEDKFSREEIGKISIKVVPQKAENLGELFKQTFQTLFSGAANGIKNVFSAFGAGLTGAGLTVLFSGAAVVYGFLSIFSFWM